MFKHFEAAHEDEPGEAWRDRFVAGRDEAARWYLGSGLAPPPRAAECRDALRRHMPELVPHYDKACALVGDDDLGHRILSHYRPPPILHGCSQAIWLGDGGPALVRNYDYPLDVVSARFELTAWSGHRVIAKAQRPWGGCLDGMNEDGLVASLTFGGSQAQGLGFSVILLLRYVLETCTVVDQAIAALCRIPIALSQNVTVLDRTGEFATVFLGPDREPAVSRLRACANHQERPLTRRSAALTDSRERQDCMLAALDEAGMTLDRLTGKFLGPPLYSRHIGFATVYTAVYLPAEGRVDYLWPGQRWSQSFDRFVPAHYTHDYGALPA
ncbi:C45 family autoproteolytic acyltransferase/hydolase [Bradyrhizobium sp.]|uniref:C45 family autoproteolytic acyltransferase/hydolase n=1 Tax=Bradyrhizobium sp. TaxID=376 RepID=UPI003C6917AC